MRRLKAPWRGVVMAGGLIGIFCVYVGLIRLLPPGKRPLYGYFSVHYDWDHGVVKTEVLPLIPPRMPLDPASRAVVRWMAIKATEKEFVGQMQLVGVSRGRGEAHVWIYGNIFPCRASWGGLGNLEDLDRPHFFNR